MARKKLPRCANCRKSIRIMAFSDDKGCSVLCQKVLKGEMTRKEANAQRRLVRT